MKKLGFLFLILLCFQSIVFSQDATTLLNKVKAKINLVNDYTATGKMKTDITFIKAPIGKVTVYFKKPNKFKLKKENGISILPKGGVSINIGAIINVEDFDIIDSGEEIIDNTITRKIILLPKNETNDVALSTMYIDAEKLLVKKVVTTTKENGTYQILLSYGNYSQYGLPDKVVFGFNTKDYKMPKGITMEFDDEGKKEMREKMKNKKGKVEIMYNTYIINKGINDAIFN
ncbi:MAG TPA: hypothetical protein PKG56_01520 [Chitinophagaceae bacterium]|nr:hypothetical protein [Chitinophagaceae bacterium]HMZ45390.1 hypothetical protein [Chitinophagaceae bacterium]HNL82045.1 hypothetical protein [Chitinophagaceae bacterium]HNM34027.1 hypothetical protein [Chitinophagaceae bacterium]